MILNCVSSSFFSSPSRPIDWLRFLVLSPFTTHACACVRKRKKKIRARTTHHHPAREDRQTDRRRNKRTIWEEEEETTRERRETIPIRRLELASGDEYQSYYERKVANNRRETRFARRRRRGSPDVSRRFDDADRRRADRFDGRFILRETFLVCDSFRREEERLNKARARVFFSFKKEAFFLRRREREKRTRDDV